MNSNFYDYCQLPKICAQFISLDMLPPIIAFMIWIKTLMDDKIKELQWESKEVQNIPKTAER